ncbi:protein delta homolog 2 isoform X2 [Denticeps clupeoides]|uniref:protein delta homolog 2 isoform X2 n=1 Tax=Denticeps clupeoides TaxID=299321 RepID=UPI0010A2B7F5|nr:protein delta homolog 2 isoform X2 [Denticeps clupeoides]
MLVALSFLFAMFLPENAFFPAETNCTCYQDNGRCDDVTGECRCDPGWAGPRCADCVRTPGCVHGSCHQPWQCTCDAGWTGRFCDKDIHFCAKQQPCRNGATCVTDEFGEYSCLCPAGFHGRNCEFKAGPCYNKRSPCKNGGLCEDDGGYAPELSCRCLAGFTGLRCETNVDDCLLLPCGNGATCLDGINRFSCLCPAGFTGRFCTVNLDDCAGQPCLNGGRCLDGINSFHCLCPQGFTGRTCEVLLPDKETVESPGPGRSTFGWSGGGGGNQSRPIPNTHPQGTTGQLVKISLKEVVTQQGPAGLSEEQLVILLVLGGMTLAVVALTAGFVLRGRCRDCQTPPTTARLQASCRAAQDLQHPAPAEQECKISFLQPPPSIELVKKKLNTEVI